MIVAAVLLEVIHTTEEIADLLSFVPSAPSLSLRRRHFSGAFSGVFSVAATAIVPACDGVVALLLGHAFDLCAEAPHD